MFEFEFERMSEGGPFSRRAADVIGGLLGSKDEGRPIAWLQGRVRAWRALRRWPNHRSTRGAGTVAFGVRGVEVVFLAFLAGDVLEGSQFCDRGGGARGETGGPVPPKSPRESMRWDRSVLMEA